MLKKDIDNIVIGMFTEVASSKYPVMLPALFTDVIKANFRSVEYGAEIEDGEYTGIFVPQMWKRDAEDLNASMRDGAEWLLSVKRYNLTHKECVYVMDTLKKRGLTAYFKK